MKPARVIIIGAGISGLTAAALLSRHGCDVTVLERASRSGGKMREVQAGGRLVDSGPTVLTMRWIFEEIFSAAGGALADSVTLEPASLLARHAWTSGGTLDLYASIAKSADAIGAFAGAREADGYRRFCAAAKRIYHVLEEPFLKGMAPSLTTLMRRGAGAPLDLWNIRPFSLLWQELGHYFADQRLRQLFARYATYCGSSPFLAPATLMLIAHVEQDGVWLVQGGMQRLAEALERLGAANGATFRHGTAVARISAEAGRVAAVTLATGEILMADAVMCTSEAAALADGIFGPDAARALGRQSQGQRSLSAMTWSLTAPVSGFALGRHNVFFSDDYAAEFDALFARRTMSRSPTIYVCAQDRGGGEPSSLRPGLAWSDDSQADQRPERLFILMNAPANGDTKRLNADEVRICQQTVFGQLERCGLEVGTPEPPMTITQPADFEALFPGSGGALYGRATHGWKASFDRPGVRTRLPGLYLAGGSVHPGAGLPMVALSGSHAAQCLMQDLALSSRSRRAVMPGGISTA